jgi:hypothetical protein
MIVPPAVLPVAVAIYAKSLLQLAPVVVKANAMIVNLSVAWVVLNVGKSSLRVKHSLRQLLVHITMASWQSARIGITQLANINCLLQARRNPQSC